MFHWTEIFDYLKFLFLEMITGFESQPRAVLFYACFGLFISLNQPDHRKPDALCRCQVTSTAETHGGSVQLAVRRGR